MQQNSSHRWHLPYGFLIRIICVFAVIAILILLDIKAYEFGASLQASEMQTLAGLCLLIVYLAYMGLLLLRPYWSPWPRWRLVYIYVLAIIALTLVTGLLTSLLLRLIGYVTIGAVVIQTRRTFGKVGFGLVCGVLIFTVVLSTLLPGSSITLSVSSLPVLSLPVGLWLIGLAFLQTFAVLGMHERAAREHNEQLVRLLLVAQQQLRAAAAHAEELAAARERMRAAQEMHDTLAQGLTAIKMHLETSTRIFSPQPDQAAHHLEQARLLAAEYLLKTRQSIAALRTDTPQTHSLPEALAHLASTWQKYGLVVHIDVSPQVYQEFLPVPLVQGCTRIVEEALSNAHTHGHARHVEIELGHEAEKLCLAITDDGEGFEPASPEVYAQSGHFGIAGMYERAHAMQGRLDLISAPGTGSQVMITAPLCASQQGDGHA
jgi:signal transduction histidine kinase